MKPTAPQRALRFEAAMPARRLIEEKTARTKICSYISDQRRIVGKTIAKREGNGQHPLPHRNFGKYMVHEMRRRISHAPAAARRTKAPMLAGIRNDAVHAADIAVNPHKTSRQNSAIKKRAQFAFHKPGNHTSALLLPRQKGFDVFGNHMIQNALFRTARVIFKSSFANAEIPGLQIEALHQHIAFPY